MYIHPLIAAFMVAIIAVFIGYIAAGCWTTYYTHDGDKCKLVWNEVLSEKQSIVILDCNLTGDK